MTLVGGALHRITPAPVNCGQTIFQTCLVTSDNRPTLTADSRVLYLHSGSELGVGCDIYCGVYGASGSEYEVQPDLGGDLPDVWPIHTNTTYYEPANDGGVAALPTADPVDPHLIAYPGLEDPADPSSQLSPLVVVDDAAQSPFVVSDDDEAQSAVAWSPDGKYLLDIESGEEAGIWAYTAAPYIASGWHAYYVLATPAQTANGGGLGYGLSMTSDGRILFSTGHDSRPTLVVGGSKVRGSAHDDRAARHG